MIAQGSQANHNGNDLECQVYGVLKQNGIQYVPQFWTDFRSVLLKKVRSDAFVVRAPGFENGLYIECRWQEGSGSADEKICYLKENIFQKYDRPVVVVIDGESTRAQYEYLLPFVDGTKLIGVFRLTQFMTFARAMSEGKGMRYCAEAFNPNQKKMF